MAPRCWAAVRSWGRTCADVADRRDAGASRSATRWPQAGFDFDRLDEARAIQEVGAYLELHIEQGPCSSRRAPTSGIVTGLAGMFGMRVTFRGRADHAGTTPMDDRRDALVGRCAGRARAPRRGLRVIRGMLRITVGTMAVEPGGFNIVPATCEFSSTSAPGRRDDLRPAPANGSPHSLGASPRRKGSSVERCGRTGNRPMTSTSA